MATADEKAAEVQGRSIEGRIFRIDAELAELAQASTKIADLQAERAVLVADLAKVAGRRPPRERGVEGVGAVRA